MGESTQEVVRDLFQKKEHRGVNLIGHVANVVTKMVQDPAKASYDKFEATSSFIKKHTFAHTDPREDYQVNIDKEKWSILRNYINQSLDLFATAKGAQIRSTPLGYMSDLETDFQMFNWAGIGFREEVVHKLSLSLRKLLWESKAKNLRFWGKIYGINKDYYVAEGELGKVTQGSQNRETEARGTGTNKFTYWVTDNIMEDWIELPDVTPEQIRVARSIKYIFKGDLNGKVVSQPKFPGKERHLLRAQIARITAATVLVPVDSYKPKDPVEGEEGEAEAEANEIEPADDFTLPGVMELVGADKWMHFHQYVLKAGRTSHLAPEGIPEDEAEDAMAAILENDPVVEERTRTADQDTPLEGLEIAYISKLVGDPQQYKDAAGDISYAVCIMKSLRWPGALTAAQNGKWANIYVGYGTKHGSLAFEPQDCEPILDEPDDRAGYPEPNHKDPPKVEGEEGEEGGEEGEGEDS
mmetsp:Transcript_63694/g.73021  ORF Transcript_63694/g.73021 Transcript_63694/m.73021 type:complete len:468 (+) Transcript_63694:57-1460(+)